MASITRSVRTGIRWAAWALAPFGVLLGLAILAVLVEAPTGLISLLGLRPFVLAPLITLVISPAILSITVSWTLLVQWKPAIERSEVIAYLSTLAWALVVVTAIGPLLTHVLPAQRMFPGISIMTTALAVLAPRVFVRSLRPGRLVQVAPTTRKDDTPTKRTAQGSPVPVLRRVAASIVGVFYLVAGSLILMALGIAGFMEGFAHVGFRVFFLLLHVYVYGTAGLSLLYSARPRKILGRVLLVLYLPAASLFIYSMWKDGHSRRPAAMETRGHAKTVR